MSKTVVKRDGVPCTSEADSAKALADHWNTQFLEVPFSRFMAPHAVGDLIQVIPEGVHFEPNAYILNFRLNFTQQ